MIAGGNEVSLVVGKDRRHDQISGSVDSFGKRWVSRRDDFESFSSGLEHELW